MEAHPKACKVLQELGYNVTEENSGIMAGPEDELFISKGTGVILFCCDCHLAHGVTAEVVWDKYSAETVVGGVSLRFERLDDVTDEIRKEMPK